MTKQTVYLPVKVEDLIEQDYIQSIDGDFYIEQEGYFFTPEQLNEDRANVIKQALETAAEKAEIKYDHFDDMAAYINTASIKNTFEETYKKFEV